mmetsp:Transcript_8280/g.12743  ORF Transcript_8280/g.12743 Transcript_8280/m.12743 type:complete len:443 (-) Transcript_8280:280-1608(-)
MQFAGSSILKHRRIMSSNDEIHDEETTGLIIDTSRNRPIGITDWEAAVSIAKAIMGAGSFALPWAFSQMGYLAGPLFLIFLMICSVYSLDLLVQASRKLKQSTTSSMTIKAEDDNNDAMKYSYVDVARANFGSIGAKMTYGASISASVGVCGSYLVFISANLKSLFGGTMSQTHWIILILPLCIMLSSIQNMNRFAFVSLMGDASVVLGMLVVLIYGFLSSPSFGKDCVAIGSLNSMPLAFGAIGYLFLIHFLSLPIETSMARPERFSTVAQQTFVVCAILSGCFGIVGYLMFGADTQQIVLLNIQQSSIFVVAVKALLCIDLLFTYPVVMRPSIIILKQSLIQRSMDNVLPSRSEYYHHVAACILLGGVAAGCSIFVPAFGVLSGLVGGVSQTFLAFVLPPLMMSRNSKRHHNRYTVLVLCGLILIVWTLLTTWTEFSSAN